MKRDAAEIVQKQALLAVQNLHEIARTLKQEEVPEIWRPLGILIGEIDYNILRVVSEQYPDLEDLDDKDLKNAET